MYLTRGDKASYHKAVLDQFSRVSDYTIKGILIDKIISNMSGVENRHTYLISSQTNSICFIITRMKVNADLLWFGLLFVNSGWGNREMKNIKIDYLDLRFLYTKYNIIDSDCLGEEFNFLSATSEGLIWAHWTWNWKGLFIAKLTFIG